MIRLSHQQLHEVNSHESATINRKRLNIHRAVSRFQIALLYACAGGLAGERSTLRPILNDATAYQVIPFGKWADLTLNLFFWGVIFHLCWASNRFVSESLQFPTDKAREIHTHSCSAIHISRQMMLVHSPLTRCRYMRLYVCASAVCAVVESCCCCSLEATLALSGTVLFTRR